MKRILFSLLIATSVFSQTRNIVPRANGEGQIGTSAKHWKAAYLDTMYLSAPLAQSKVAFFADTLATRYMAKDTTAILASKAWVSGLGHQPVGDYATKAQVHDSIWTYTNQEVKTSSSPTFAGITATSTINADSLHTTKGITYNNGLHSLGNDARLYWSTSDYYLRLATGASGNYIQSSLGELNISGVDRATLDNFNVTSSLSTFSGTVNADSLHSTKGVSIAGGFSSFEATSPAPSITKVAGFYGNHPYNSYLNGTSVDISWFSKISAYRPTNSNDMVMKLSATPNVATPTVFEDRLTLSYAGATVLRNLFVDQDANQMKGISFLSSGLQRWYIASNNTTESGDATGSDLTFYTYNNAGAYLGAPLTISRSTGNATFTNNVTANYLYADSLHTTKGISVGGLHAEDGANAVHWLTSSDWNASNTTTLRLGNSHPTYKNSSPFIRSTVNEGIDKYNLSFGTSNVGDAVERMNIRYDGKIGFGTNQLIYKVTILDSVTGVEPTLLSLASYNGSSPNLDLGVNSTGYGYIQSMFRGMPYSTVPLAINPNGGNVGIGFTSPLSKLSVNGGLHVGGESDAGDNNLLVDGTLTIADGTSTTFSTRKGANSDGYNIWIGGGGLSAVGVVGETYRGAYNSAVGVDALYYNSTGYYNSAVGVSTLYSNTSGYYNSTVGVKALYSNTIGYSNSAVGTNVLYSNTTGAYNSAVGISALYSNTSGYYNSAVGVSTLYSNTVGYSNSAVGTNALYSNTVGYYNSAVGTNALFDLNITANEGSGANTAIGYNTGRGIVTGINNTILGANVTGLASNLSNNIILADGAGNIRLQFNSSGNATLTSASVKIGSGADTVSINSTAWDDIMVNLTASNKGAVDKPLWYADSGAYRMIQDSTEILSGSVEVPHDYMAGTSIHPHVHVLQTSTADTAQFTLKWKWHKLGNAGKDEAWHYTTLNQHQLTYTSGEMQQITEGNEMDGTGKTLSSVIVYQLKRKNAGGLTNSFVFNLGFHYRKGGLGSRQEFIP